MNFTSSLRSLIFVVALLSLAVGARADKPFTLTATDFAAGQPMPLKYSQKHGEASPELHIENVPAKAKSLALIMEDPDAVEGVFTHWVVWNLSPTLTIIPENKMPAGAHVGKNGDGNAIYTGPAPPSGNHHYYFRLYALDTMLDLPAGADRKALEKAMQGHIVAGTKMYGTYAAGQ